MPQTAGPDSIGSEAGVSLDHSSLRGQPAGGDTRYTIAVRGVADEAWAEAYRSVQETAVPLRRFVLDRRTRTVAFSCPSVEGPAFVFEMLERLEGLLELVDRRLLSDRARATGVAPAPALRTIV